MPAVVPFMTAIVGDGVNTGYTVDFSIDPVQYYVATFNSLPSTAVLSPSFDPSKSTLITVSSVSPSNVGISSHSVVGKSQLSVTFSSTPTAGSIQQFSGWASFD